MWSMAWKLSSPAALPKAAYWPSRWGAGSVHKEELGAGESGSMLRAMESTAPLMLEGVVHAILGELALMV